MSEPRSRASDLVAQQVEQIVVAAQDAADQIRDEAQSERKEVRAQAQRDAECLREKARAEIETARQKSHDKAEAELNEARKQAVLLGQDARREADGTVADAEQHSKQVREQTRNAVEGRVATAEKAAAQVLLEAETLSGGLHQLGRALSDQADRILRDVQAAHKRMQADLRVESGIDLPLSSSARSAGAGGARSPDWEAVTPRRRPSAEGGAASRERANPLEGLEVPGWSPGGGG